MFVGLSFSFSQMWHEHPMCSTGEPALSANQCKPNRVQQLACLITIKWDIVFAQIAVLMEAI